MKYISLALGGTFDHLHKGHRYFLTKAFSLSDHVTVGITSDKFARSLYKKGSLQSLEARRKELEMFLIQSGLTKRSKLTILSNPFGPTLKDKSLKALLVTRNTIKGGLELNKKRKEKNLKLLKIIRCPLKLSEDGKPIASQKIRNGEIDREGKHFSSRLLKAVPIKISQPLREEFRKPFGKVFLAKNLKTDQLMNQVKEDIKKKNLEPIICVGDVVTKSFLKIGGKPKLKIIDLRVLRKKLYNKTSQLGPIEKLHHIIASNPAGMITLELVQSIAKGLKRKSPSVILVKGEEDLAVLPCVLLAPLNSVILYGHFKLGIIAVEITEAKKSEALNLLTKIKKAR